MNNPDKTQSEFNNRLTPDQIQFIEWTQIQNDWNYYPTINRWQHFTTIKTTQSLFDYWNENVKRK